MAGPERRRPFSSLRLAGTSLLLLRRVITLEAADPVIIAAAVSALPLLGRMTGPNTAATIEERADPEPQPGCGRLWGGVSLAIVI